MAKWLKWLLVALVALVVCASSAHARGKLDGFCTPGGKSVPVAGTAGSLNNKFQQVYPACVVTVYLTGTTTLATLYSDLTGTGQANPFTASTATSTTPGYWNFYADEVVDVQLSGGTPVAMPNAITLGFKVPQAGYAISNYGAACNNSTESSAALVAIAALTAQTTIRIPSGCIIYVNPTTTITVPRNVSFSIEQGGGINFGINTVSGTPAHPVTIQGQIIAGLYQVFYGSVLGTTGIVTTAGSPSTLTWVAGSHFNNSWTGAITVWGTAFTISSVNHPTLALTGTVSASAPTYIGFSIGSGLALYGSNGPTYPEWFGALGDSGTTDNAPPINDTCASVRAANTNIYLRFTGTQYALNSPTDCGGFGLNNAIIEGNYTFMSGATDGLYGIFSASYGPIMDISGTHGVNFERMELVGHSTSTPPVGVLAAVQTAHGGDYGGHNKFTGNRFGPKFTQAGLAILGADDDTLDHNGIASSDFATGVFMTGGTGSPTAQPTTFISQIMSPFRPLRWVNGLTQVVGTDNSWFNYSNGYPVAWMIVDGISGMLDFKGDEVSIDVNLPGYGQESNVPWVLFANNSATLNLTGFKHEQNGLAPFLKTDGFTHGHLQGTVNVVKAADTVTVSSLTTVIGTGVFPFQTGTVTTATTGKLVTLTGGATFFPNMQGNIITINGVQLTVASVISTTSLTTTTDPTNQSGVTYTYSYWVNRYVTIAGVGYKVASMQSGLQLTLASNASNGGGQALVFLTPEIDLSSTYGVENGAISDSIIQIVPSSTPGTALVNKGSGCGLSYNSIFLYATDNLFCLGVSSSGNNIFHDLAANSTLIQMGSSGFGNSNAIYGRGFRMFDNVQQENANKGIASNYFSSQAISGLPLTVVNGTTTAQDYTIAGVSQGAANSKQVCLVSSDQPLLGLVVTCSIKSANTVTVTISNNSAAPIVLTTGNFTFLIFHVLLA